MFLTSSSGSQDQHGADPGLRTASVELRWWEWSWGLGQEEDDVALSHLVDGNLVLRSLSFIPC